MGGGAFALLPEFFQNYRCVVVCIVYPDPDACADGKQTNIVGTLLAEKKDGMPRRFVLVLLIVLKSFSPCTASAGAKFALHTHLSAGRTSGAWFPGVDADLPPQVSTVAPTFPLSVRNSNSYFSLSFKETS